MMIPGRILVVDDKRYEVDELVDEFLRRGEHATYSGVTIESGYCTNVRLLIIDYWLIEDSESDSLNAITTIVNEVAEKSRFFMLVVWSAKVTEDNRRTYRENILNRYKTLFEKELPGILLDPISKDELNYVGLINKIEVEIGNHPDLNLIYEIERIFDTTKDRATNQIYEIGNWSNLIRNLKIEYDLDSIRRQVLYIYINMLKRYLTPTESKRLKKCIKQMVKEEQPFSVEDFAKVYSSQYYFRILKSERIGTGDILHNKKLNRYYIVITPECDIAFDKHTSTKLIEARRIEHSRLEDADRIEKVKEDSPALSNIKSGREVIDAVLYGRGLKANYYNLNFLYDYEKEGFFHLIFDFHRVKSLRKAKKLHELKGYRRICRVESPLVNDFIQRYASHCSRFGTMTIPQEASEILKSRLHGSGQSLT